MPRLASSLTELQVRRAKPGDKPYSLSDGNGLVLVLEPASARRCRRGPGDFDGQFAKLALERLAAAAVASGVGHRLVSLVALMTSSATVDISLC